MKTPSATDQSSGMLFACCTADLIAYCVIRAWTHSVPTFQYIMYIPLELHVFSIYLIYHKVVNIHRKQRKGSNEEPEGR